MGGGAELVAAEPLRPDGRPWLLQFLRSGTSGPVVQAVVKTGDAEWRAELATEAAALAVAEAHGLAAPRVIDADLVGDEAGALAVLFTFVDGSSDIPLDASRERLQALGAAAAEFHAVPRQPCDELPLRERHMPWIDLSSERRAGEQPSTPLLDAGDELLTRLPDPVAAGEQLVFVHGDLWQGNTMWLGDGTYAGTIDWEAAGAGSYGVDLGSLRLDAALLHGAPSDAYDEIVAGWERASGQRVKNLAYWDLVAALNTSADMSAFLPTMHQAGRADLDGPLLTARRDAFLQAAIDRLGG